MEDTHIMSASFGEKKISLFGVFDGHGGTLLCI
jgi:serine/threonine protein phosphatase PrpC